MGFRDLLAARRACGGGFRIKADGSLGGKKPSCGRFLDVFYANRGKFLGLCWFVLFGAAGLGAFDVGLRGIRAEFTFKPEYHRSFDYCQQFATVAEALIQDSYTIRGGLALGQTGTEFDVGIFLGAAYRFPLSVDLRFHLSYLYNAIPGYRYRTNTLFPFLSYLGKWWGLDLGPSLRFTSFGTGPSIFEPIVNFRVFVHILNKDMVKLLAGVGNFSAFSTGNLGAYYSFLENRIDLKEGTLSCGLSALSFRGQVPRLSLINRLEFYQTGSIGLTSAFQGFAWQGGVRLSW
jgi:hypothetical protein